MPKQRSEHAHVRTGVGQGAGGRGENASGFRV